MKAKIATEVLENSRKLRLQTSMRLISQLPLLYQRFLPKLVQQIHVLEKKATCDSCLMSKSPVKKNERYRADLKCCTFHPFLPNYIVGALLSDPHYTKPAEVIRNKIQNRQWDLPIGIPAPIPYQVIFNQKKPGQFGQIEEWLCPYYDREADNCGIWLYRGAVCTSFYCKSSYGKKGIQFWNKLSDYMTYVEMALLEEILIRLDFSPRQLSDNLEFLNRKKATSKEMRSSGLPLLQSRQLWNGYYEEREDFYRKCYRLAMELNPDIFREGMGETGAAIEQELLMAYRELGK